MNKQIQKIKALWLCSWFPDKVQEQNGDFIERQAIAASAFAQIDVLHAAPAPKSILGNKQTEEIFVQKNDSLRYTTILYFKKNEQLHNKIRSFFQYFAQYKKLIRRYITTNGLPDIIHVHIAFKDGIIALQMKKKYNVPYILSEHWSLYHKENGQAFKQKNFLFRIWIKKILKNATIVLPVSGHLGNVLKNIAPNIRFQVVSNVVNTELFNYKIPKSGLVDFTFIHISTLLPNKNPKGIIEAFLQVNKKFPFSKLVLIGEIKNLDTPIDNANITLIDTIPNDAVAFYLQKSQAFILFSYTESQPCVLLESFCCGAPVIATNVGGISEIVHEKNGILIDAGNVPLLAEKMCYMIQNYAQYNRQAISEAAISHYNYKKIGADIYGIYSDIFSSKIPST